jgi:hypothetical protein
MASPIGPRPGPPGAAVTALWAGQCGGRSRKTAHGALVGIGIREPLRAGFEDCF